MPHLPCTTIAGRLAADIARARDQQLRGDIAIEQLSQALSRRGLLINEHLDPSLGADRSIWVNCRVATCYFDHGMVYAVLDEHDWHPDCARLSRTNSRYDIVRIRHGATHACLVIIIKLPNAAIPQWEAA